MDPRILDIDGWMADQELEWLHATASKLPPDAIAVELGAWYGKSSAALFTGAGPECTVVSVDTWLGTETEPAHDIAKTVDICAGFKANMANLGIELLPFQQERKGAQFIRMDSVEASKHFADASVSLLFLDDDHRTPGLSLDAWLPKMMSPSIVCGHDYFCFYEYIQPQVHDRLAHIHEIHHSIWVRYWPGDEAPEWYRSAA
jgi:hypothetical protein